MSPVFACMPCRFPAGVPSKEGTVHLGGGRRGSALRLEEQRWEAVFRRERMPASIDRTSDRSLRGFCINKEALLFFSRFPKS